MSLLQERSIPSPVTPRYQQEAVNRLCVGNVVECEYRAANAEGEFTLWEKRRFVVELVTPNHHTRDASKPLARGEWAVEAFDLDRWERVTLYLESMRNIVSRELAEDSAVHWVVTPDDWQPGDDLPADAKLEEQPIATGIDRVFAEAIVDAGNRFMLAAGRKGRWLTVRPAEASPKAEESAAEDQSIIAGRRNFIDGINPLSPNYDSTQAWAVVWIDAPDDWKEDDGLTDDCKLIRVMAAPLSEGPALYIAEAANELSRRLEAPFRRVVVLRCDKLPEDFAKGSRKSASAEDPTGVASEPEAKTGLIAEPAIA